MQFDEGENKEYKVCMKEVRDALKIIYDLYVTTKSPSNVNVNNTVYLHSIDSDSDGENNMEGGSSKAFGVESEDDFVVTSRIPQINAEENREESEKENEDASILQPIVTSSNEDNYLSDRNIQQENILLNLRR